MQQLPSSASGSGRSGAEREPNEREQKDENGGCSAVSLARSLLAVCPAASPSASASVPVPPPCHNVNAKVDRERRE